MILLLQEQGQGDKVLELKVKGLSKKLGLDVVKSTIAGINRSTNVDRDSSENLNL